MILLSEKEIFHLHECSELQNIPLRSWEYFSPEQLFKGAESPEAWGIVREIIYLSLEL